jgi:predicted transcriptional regulator
VEEGSKVTDVLSTANYSQYKPLQSFATIEALNESVRAFLYKHKHELAESAVNVLKLLARHSCKIIGVSFLKVNTIATSLEISSRTVRRALKTLDEQYGVIERKTTLRTEGKLRGGNGHNVYVIKPFDTSVMPTVLPDLSLRDEAETPTESKGVDVKLQGETKPCEAGTLVDLKNEINVNTAAKEIPVDELDQSFTPEIVPVEFKNVVSPFFNSASKIYELYQRVIMAYKRCKLDKPIEEVIDTVISSFKETIFAKKMNRIRETFNGYFYRILEAKLIVERRKECFAGNSELYFDWLEEGT